MFSIVVASKTDAAVVSNPQKCFVVKFQLDVVGHFVSCSPRVEAQAPNYAAHRFAVEVTTLCVPRRRRCAWEEHQARKSAAENCGGRLLDHT